MEKTSGDNCICQKTSKRNVENFHAFKNQNIMPVLQYITKNCVANIASTVALLASLTP